MNSLYVITPLPHTMPAEILDCVALTEAQYHAALHLGRGYGHGWATDKPLVWFEGITLKDIRYNYAVNSNNDYGPDGIAYPNAGWVSRGPDGKAAWVLVHETCTGATRWQIWPNGTVVMGRLRPDGGWYQDSTFVSADYKDPLDILMDMREKFPTVYA